MTNHSRDKKVLKVGHFVYPTTPPSLENIKQLRMNLKAYKQGCQTFFNTENKKQFQRLYWVTVHIEILN
jgi:hypothetical protein